MKTCCFSFFAPDSLGALKSERSRSQANRSALLGGPGERFRRAISERTRRAESRLGEPTKQNAGERRARLGRRCRQAKQCPREEGRKQRNDIKQSRRFELDRRWTLMFDASAFRSPFAVLSGLPQLEGELASTSGASAWRRCRWTPMRPLC